MADPDVPDPRSLSEVRTWAERVMGRRAIPIDPADPDNPWQPGDGRPPWAGGPGGPGGGHPGGGRPPKEE